MEKLSTRGWSFHDIAAAEHKGDLLAALGYSDPLEVAALVTEWGKVLGQLSAPQDAARVLARQFERQDLRTREPWRIEDEKQAAERDAISKLGMPVLQRLFVDLAKAKRIAPEDAVNLFYALYSDEAGRRFWASTLQSKVGVERVRAHNFYVVSLMADRDAFMARSGDLLPALPVPLWPAVDELASLNTALMVEFREYMQGTAGGGRSRFYSSLYGRQQQPSGGGILPVHQDAHGQLGVEVGVIEDTCNMLRRQNESLKRQVAALERKLADFGLLSSQRGRGRGGFGGRGGRLYGGDLTQTADDRSFGLAPLPPPPPPPPQPPSTATAPPPSYIPPSQPKHGLPYGKN